jgi:hypothetical protein
MRHASKDHQESYVALLESHVALLESYVALIERQTQVLAPRNTHYNGKADESSFLFVTYQREVPRQPQAMRSGISEHWPTLRRAIERLHHTLCEQKVAEE